MSLINDALKRASQSEKQKSDSQPVEPLRQSTMQPVDRIERSPALVFPILLVASMAAAAWFFFQWWQMKDNARPQSVAAAEQPLSAGQQVTLTRVDLETSSQPAESDVAALGGDDAISRTELEPVPVPALPPEPVFPALKVQGIFYRVASPSALINGKTVAVGDLIEGARVTAIRPQSVAVEFKGEVRVFEL